MLIISNQHWGLSANVRTLWLLSATSEWAILEATNLLSRVTARASDRRKDCQWSDWDPIKKVYFVKHALDHIWHDQTRAPKFCIWPYSGAYLCSPYINKWGIPETQKKMQFRRVGLVSVGVSQSKVTTNITLSQDLFCHFVLQNIVICNESCVGFFTLFR